MARLKDTGDGYDVATTQDKLKRAYNLNVIADTTNAAKESVNGLLIGAIVGTVGAYFLKHNIYYGAAFGALVGGIVGFSSSKV